MGDSAIRVLTRIQDQDDYSSLPDPTTDQQPATKKYVDDNAGSGTQNNFSATVQPTVTDDSDSGYSAGSLWSGTTLDGLYVCIDATVGAAVWRALAFVPVPVAEFSATPLSGNSPLEVAFTDESTGSPTEWLWDFGDGDISTEQNPTHEYTDIGDFDVSLTVTNVAGSDNETKTDYISASLDPSSLPGFLWDSGEDPALGSSVPGSFSPDLSTAEIWIVSRGHGACPLDLGNGSQAMLYMAGMSSTGVDDIHFLEGAVNPILKTSIFLPRVSKVAWGYHGNGGSSIAPFVNGVAFSGVVAATNTTTGGTVGERTGAGTFNWLGAIHRVLIYSANLSAGNRTALLSYLRSHYGFQAYTKQVLFDGDSLTAGYNSDEHVLINGWTDNSDNYPYAMPAKVAADHTDWKVLNHGITAETLANLLAHAAASIDPYYDAANFAKNVVVLWAGTNDIIGGTALATVESNFASYVSARQGAGFKVVAIPILDRGGFSAGQRTDKDSFNTWLNAGSSGADAVVTLPASLSGNSAWVGNPTKWDSDHTHLTQAGYYDLATPVETAISSV